MPRKPRKPSTIRTNLDFGPGEESSTLPRSAPKPVPREPRLDELLREHHGHSASRYSIFDYWFCAIVTPDQVGGWWVSLYEYEDDHWRYLNRFRDSSSGQAFLKAAKHARKMLIEGHRPKATKASPELAKLVNIWSDTGEYALARDARAYQDAPES